MISAKMRKKDQALPIRGLPVFQSLLSDLTDIGL